MGRNPSNVLNNTEEKTPRKRRKNSNRKEKIKIEKTVDKQRERLKFKMIEECWIIKSRENENSLNFIWKNFENKRIFFFNEMESTPREIYISYFDLILIISK